MAVLPSDVALPQRLVLYDGVCGLCNRTVQWLIRHDPEGHLAFAPLQGPTAAGLRSRHTELPHGIDSVVYVERHRDGEKVYWRSQAIVRAVRDLHGTRWVRLLRVVPRRLADATYDGIARGRYRVWGRLDACPLPRPELAHRFLP